MLGLDIDRGESRLRRTAQQPQAGDSAARADLDDVQRAPDGGDGRTLHADCRADRFGAQLQRSLASAGDRVGFDRDLFDESIDRVISHALPFP